MAFFHRVPGVGAPRVEWLRWSVLEGILQEVRRQEERAKVEKSIDAYYSSLSDEQASEHAEWGDFATNEFLRQE
jgi:hypothetical protein